MDQMSKSVEDGQKHAFLLFRHASVSLPPGARQVTDLVELQSHNPD